MWWDEKTNRDFVAFQTGKDTVTEQPRQGASMPGPSSSPSTPPASENSPLAPSEAPPSYDSVFPEGSKQAAWGSWESESEQNNLWSCTSAILYYIATILDMQELR